MKNFFAILLAVSIFICWFISAGAEDLLKETADLYKNNSYEKYIVNYANAELPAEEIMVSGADFSKTDMDAEVFDRYEGSSGKAVKTTENGFMEWTVNIKTGGLYNIGVRYFPIEGKSSAIERELQIDGKFPFNEARSILFQRIWENASGIKRDNRGNDLIPRQLEHPMWQETVLKDLLGYYNEAYKFYFTKGLHTIRLVSIKEPMIIESLKIFQDKPAAGYSAIQQEYGEKAYKPASDVFIKIQAEDAVYKSDPTLVPLYDHSSPLTEPYDKSKIRLNMFGGYRWALPGMWATWDFDVKEDGLYKIALKVRQNTVRGIYSTRKVMIDGKVPFKELEKIVFKYDSKWKLDVLGGDEPYLVYLTRGKHQIRLESTLGDMSYFLRTAENSVYELNNAFRKIIMITGTTPDPFRDYRLDQKIPGVLAVLGEQGDILYRLSDELKARTGQKGRESAILTKLAYQLKDMVNRPETIQKRIDNFKINVGALGAWVLEIKQEPVDLDYIVVASPEMALPKAEASLLGKVVHEIRAFIASFTEDYNTIGNKYSADKAVTVWIGAGRDQAQVLKDMIDSVFTPETGIAINLKLVQGGLLPATVAGKGPDVALGVGNGDPVNYATRNAVIDLSLFPDYKEVEKWFKKSGIVPFEFQNGVYGLPEKQTFPMFFYRKDILDSLNLKVPETLSDIYEMLPVLQRFNMNLGIPVTDINTGGAVSGVGMTTYGILLYQNGGMFYKEDGTASDLDSEIGINAFRKWTQLYTEYKLPLKYDFANRFRTGEMPVGIADYTFYNTLVVSAPEIRGLWEFIPVPGLENADGSINRSVPGTGSACMILKSSKDKDASWEFLKWWVRADTQVQFGREMESLMGAAARYPTANMDALSRLPWPEKDLKNLMKQLEWVSGIPEVPGGYFTGRHLDNAFRQVINNGDDPRETLLDYTLVINKEIYSKRKEFGLKQGE